MKQVIGVGHGVHDLNLYDGDVHINLERFSRIRANSFARKSKLKEFELFNDSSKDINKNFFTDKNLFWEPFHNVIMDTFDNDIDYAITMCRSNSNAIFTHYAESHCDADDVYGRKHKNIWDYTKCKNYYFVDHHQAHAALAFLSSGFEDSDILAYDGGGQRFCAIFIRADGEIIDLSEHFQIGCLWEIVSKITRENKDSPRTVMSAPKLMGLAGFSNNLNFEFYEDLNRLLLSKGKISSDIDVCDRATKFVEKWKEEASINGPDLAYTLTQFSIDTVNTAIDRYKSSDNICISGGVGYNGIINETLFDSYKNVYVPSAPGDEGLALGSYMHYMYTQHNIRHKPSAYNGLEYTIVD